MGKGKSKSKSKSQKLPEEKFLVVVDPWRYRHFIQDLGGWFEIMLRDEYPGTRVNMIYMQGSNHNAIVELPEHVDTRPLLGAHYHSIFLKPPYNLSADGVSYIYEYNVQTYGHPAYLGGLYQFFVFPTPFS